MTDREDADDELEQEEDSRKDRPAADQDASEQDELILDDFTSSAAGGPPDEFEEPVSESAQEFKPSNDIDAELPEVVDADTVSEVNLSGEAVETNASEAPDAEGVSDESGEDSSTSSVPLDSELAETTHSAASPSMPDWKTLSRLPDAPDMSKGGAPEWPQWGHQPTAEEIESSLAEMKEPPLDLFRELTGTNINELPPYDFSQWSKRKPDGANHADASPSAVIGDLVYRPGDHGARIDVAVLRNDEPRSKFVQLSAPAGDEPPDPPGDEPPRPPDAPAQHRPDAGPQPAPRVMMIVTVNNVERIVAEELGQAARTIAGVSRQVAEAVLEEHVFNQRSAERAFDRD